MRRGLTESKTVKFAVDVDGVLADIHARLCAIHNKRTGKHATIDDIKRWTFWLDPPWQMTEQEFLEIHAAIWDDWTLIPPTEPSLADAIRNLQKHGVVDILTARRKDTVEPAEKWLAAQGIPYRKLVVTKNTVDKAQLDYDVFIDDSDVVMTAIAKKPNTWGILYPRPWTENYPLPTRVVRATSWAQIENSLKLPLSFFSPGECTSE